MKCSNLVRGVLCCLLLFAVTTLHAQSSPSLVEAAKKEGKLVYYTVLTLPESRTLVTAFEKKYPFIKTELFRLEGDNMRAKIATEARAGRYTVDITSNSITNIGLLMRDGMIGRYQSSARERIWPGLKDRDGYWTGLYVRLYVIAYNTKMVAPRDAPRDWWDLLDPKWSGEKIGLDEEIELYGSLVVRWGKAKAEKLFKGLAAQKPMLRRGHTLIAQMMAAGEFPVSIAYGNRIEEMKGKGAPVDWASTADPVVASPSVIGMFAQSPHPNAAQLFIDFALSADGQSLLRTFDRVAAHMDIPAPVPKLDLKNLKVFFVDTTVPGRFEEFQKDYQAIFR
ncbi:MAG: extracellular solute-binding protein [Deltaproteobacteria bacterium]|nr:extracellular solute-binding protein [Deltaproteobacteria bacterium]